MLIVGPEAHSFPDFLGRELAGEIILTLGEAFEIAYQMALKEKAEQDADLFDKQCTSDGDDATSVSSKTSTNTV
ncbi:ankyrin repeat and sterile alpha motif domain-containing protein 1b [Plakobranchus ocellatus]|uniref:Ankyrin repeat and sterile alpha motif domain-containing protein 1b n=1 Tax=Plakobranchus ocellatus TaxID=259542 RepID=A0AAV4DBZ5_9GAST|nr:ankyrin repeat and sterile alpha motif domain-containing protein 1b [Plakobranchus ocellatus]